jgi:hypothetical protein
MMAEVFARTSFRRTIVRRAVLGVLALSVWVCSAAYASHQFGAAFVPKAPEPVDVPAAAEPADPQPEPKLRSEDESTEPAPV